MDSPGRANTPAARSFSDELSEGSSWHSSSTSSEDSMSPVTPSLRERWRAWRVSVAWRRLPLPRLMNSTRRKGRGRWPWWKYLLIVVGVLLVFGIIVGAVYIYLITAIIHKFTPPPNYSGLQHIVENWRAPDTYGAHEAVWRDDFSRDIVPKKCHSHNDYWRSVPLFSALAAGCTSVEADVWLAEDGALLVSHSWESTTPPRTLKSLYYDGEKVHHGPLTIVGTGNIALESVLSNHTNRFVFFDAPLLSIATGNTTFNNTNSYERRAREDPEDPDRDGAGDGINEQILGYSWLAD